MSLLHLYLVIFSIIHPIKMTTSKLIYDQEAGDIKVTVNFFWDDFGDELMKQYHLNESIDLKESETEEFLQDYITKYFQVTINEDSKVDLTVTNFELIQENVLQVSLVSGQMRGALIKQIELTNLLLVEAFPSDQVNVTHIELGDKTILRFSREESVQLVFPNYKCY